MKRGQLGDVSVDTETYWTRGKGTQDLKCNETNLYADIDDMQESAVIAKDSDELQYCYSQMDMLFLCLNAVDVCGSDDDKLRRAGRIIAKFREEGSFNLSFITVEEENQYVNILIDRLQSELEEGYDYDIANEWTEWYEEVVVEYNYYHNFDDSITKDKPRTNGLGVTYDNDYFSSQLKENSMCLLYHVCDSATLKDGCNDENLIIQKKYAESDVVEWFANSGTNMTKYSVNMNIKSGIKAKTGKTPEDALKQFKEESQKEGVEGLGFIGTLITIIAMAIVAICKLVTAIMAKKEAEEAAKLAEIAATAPTESTIDYASPSEDDYGIGEVVDELNNRLSETGLTDEEKNMLYIFGGGALLAIITAIGIKMAKKK